MNTWADNWAYVVHFPDAREEVRFILGTSPVVGGHTVIDRVEGVWLVDKFTVRGYELDGTWINGEIWVMPATEDEVEGFIGHMF